MSLTPAVQSDAPDPTETALRVLRAGYPGQHPEIGEDTVWLWQQALGRYPSDVLLEAAAGWAQAMPRFPSLHDYLGQVRAVLRRRARAAGPCAECGTSTYVLDEATDSARPCSICRPADHARWLEGGPADG
jgi:hypothetical protein